jgi:hypothetical protein
MEVLVFLIFCIYAYFFATGYFALILKSILQNKVCPNQQDIITNDIDWDNLGEKLMYPDTSDQGAVDTALEILMLEEQAATATDSEKKAMFEGKLRDEYKHLVELTLLTVGPPPSLSDPDYDFEFEAPSNIIDFPNAPKTTK